MDIHPLTDSPEHTATVVRWLRDEWSAATAETPSELCARLLGPERAPATLLAVRGGEPVGVLAFRRFRREGDLHQSLFVDALYVHAPERGLGVGSTLLARGVAEARAFAPELHVYTEKRGWYETRGFTLVSALPDGKFFVLSRAL